MKSPGWTFVFISMTLLAPQAQAVYKCASPSGAIVYQQAPCANEQASRPAPKDIGTATTPAGGSYRLWRTPAHVQAREEVFKKHQDLEERSARQRKKEGREPMDFASIARTLYMPELQRRGAILRIAAQCGADEASIQRFIDALANDIQTAPVHRLPPSEMESIFQAGQSHGGSIYRKYEPADKDRVCQSPLRAVVQGRHLDTETYFKVFK